VDTQLLFICFLTFVIHLIGTLAYSIRIAGVRTRRIAVSLTLFGLLMLVSRTSNSFLGPFLAKRVETSLDAVASTSLLGDFRWLLVSASLATVAGALLIPTLQRVFCRAILHFQAHRSIPKLILHGVFKGGLSYVRDVASMPAARNMTDVRSGHGVSGRITLLNVGATALWTVGVFAALYAGVLDPSVRVTSSTLSSGDRTHVSHPGTARAASSTSSSIASVSAARSTGPSTGASRAFESSSDLTGKTIARTEQA